MKKIIPILLILSGCMVGPDYKTPQNDTSEQWESASDTITDRTEPLQKWWESFRDPLLDNLITLTTAHNNSLKAAEENILEAKAIAKIIASRLYPQLDADFNAQREAKSENTLLPLIPIPPIQNLFGAGLNLSWKIDLFGQTRRAMQAAEANVGNVVEQKNDLLISLFAQVGQNYITLRGNQALAQLIQEQIALIEQTLAITKKRFDAGYISALDAAQVEAALAAARATLPPVQATIYASIYALSILTGSTPTTLLSDTLTPAPIPSLPDVIAIGLPSDLLRRRPDVRAQERLLALNTALVGVAVSAFYPSFSLTADGGFQSLKIKNLFDSNSKTWSLGADLLLPLFRGGRLVGQLRATEARLASAGFTYQQTILNALQQTQTALTNYVSDRSKTTFLEENVAYTDEKTTLTGYQYEAGLVSLPPYLALKRELNLTRQTLVNSRITALTDLITLYQALGGGWEYTAPGEVL